MSTGRFCEIMRPWFMVMWWTIGAVSAYDAYLVVRYNDVILELERNPVCRYLIEQNDGDPALFLVAKATGTAVVLTVLLGIRACGDRSASAITASVATFQLSLLAYLALA